MSFLPDLPPTTEYASSAVPLRPTLRRNLSFWLLAMLLGSMFMLIGPVLGSNFKSKIILNFLNISGLATILSSAALPLLLLRLPWALTASSVGLRWLRVFTLQCLSLVGLTALAYALVGEMLGPAALVGGTVYFAAGLLAAVLVYWPWLRRPQ